MGEMQNAERYVTHLVESLVAGTADREMIEHFAFLAEHAGATLGAGGWIDVPGRVGRVQGWRKLARGMLADAAGPCKQLYGRMTALALSPLNMHEAALAEDVRHFPAPESDRRAHAIARLDAGQLAELDRILDDMAENHSLDPVRVAKRAAYAVLLDLERVAAEVHGPKAFREQLAAVARRHGIADRWEARRDRSR